MLVAQDDVRWEGEEDGEAVERVKRKGRARKGSIVRGREGGREGEGGKGEGEGDGSRGQLASLKVRSTRSFCFGFRQRGVKISLSRPL